MKSIFDFFKDPKKKNVDEAFQDQEDYEEVVEIDEQGRVYKPGDAPRPVGKKPTILRDPHGEFSLL